MKNIKFNREFVYFEKQKSDRLCGLHCLNALLQGPFFNVGQLSEIALELDKKEKNLYNSNKIDSNVDLDGNFNIQVLTKALNNYNCIIKNVKQSEVSNILNNNSTNQNFGFIFNSIGHWFAIRKIEDIWFNLNSTNSSPGPEIISDFYLSLFIDSCANSGYTIFFVKNLPLKPLNDIIYQNLQNYQSLVSLNEILKAKEVNDKKKKEREELIKLKREQEKFNQENNYIYGNMIDYYNYENYPSQYYNDIYENYQNINNFPYYQNYQNEYHPLDTFENDIQKAKELSLSQHYKELEKKLPREPIKGFSISINYKGKILNRKFSENDTIGDIKNYIKCQLKINKNFEIYQSQPKKFYNNDDMTIKEAGFGYNQMLNVDI